MRTARPTIQRLTGGLAALALGASLTACGGSDGSEATDAPAASSSSPTDTASEPAPDASESATEPAPIDDGGQIDPQVFIDRIQNGLKNTTYAHVSFTMSGAGAGMEGQGDTDYTVKPANMKMTMKIGPQELSVLLVDKVMYVESPQAPGKFIKYDLDDPKNPLGSQLTDQLDPAASMSQFAEAVTAVTSLGEEEVDGETLDHFTMTIDTSKLTAKSSPGMPAELTADMWLDDQDRMARSSIDLGEATYDATMSDFDKPVHITAPPASQVLTPPGT